MRVHTYVVQHDKGFAPNPFWGVCTLACCKPRIRERAEKGDVIIGFGSASKKVGLGNRVVYWMRVEDIISFDEYWKEPRYASKRPVFGGSLMAWYGDNIYHKDEGSLEWKQTFSFHTDDTGLNQKRDTSQTDLVLISRDYAYWGGSGPVFPDNLLHLVPSFQAERYRYTDDDRDKILAWIDDCPERGFRAEPADWRFDHKSTLK